MYDDGYNQFEEDDSFSEESPNEDELGGFYINLNEESIPEHIKEQLYNCYLQTKEDERRNREADRLIADGPYRDCKVNDRVLFACGLIGIGNWYDREEGTVIDVTNDSVKIRIDYPESKGYFERWIHASFVLEILQRKRE